MANKLPLLEEDLNIIQKLPDEPNDVGGLTSAQLKAKFDQAGNAIREYINQTLLPAVESMGIPGGGDFRTDGSVPMAGDVDMAGHGLHNLSDPEQDTDAAHKKYVDALAERAGQPGGLATLDEDGLLPEEMLSTYKKEELLSPATRALLGVEESALPDDALTALHKSASAAVGDILQTVRTDLDDTWLLCNGEAVPAECDELNRLLYKTVTTHVGSASVTAPKKLYAAASDGAVVVAVGGYAGTGTGSYPFMMIGQGSELNIWKYKTVPEKGAGLLYDIAYYDGVWVAVGQDDNDDGTVCGLILVTRDPLGEWTRKEYPELDGTAARFNGVTCHEGTWAVCGNTGHVFSTDDPFGDWTGVQVADGSGAVKTGNLLSIANHKGTWVTHVGAGSYATDDLAGAWTTVNFLSSSVKRLRSCGDVLAAVGTGTLQYTANPYTSWTSVSATSNLVLRDIACHNGVWIAVGYPFGYDSEDDYYDYEDDSTSAQLIYAADPAGPWTQAYVTASDGSTKISASLLGLASRQDDLIAAGVYHDSDGAAWGRVLVLSDVSAPTRWRNPALAGFSSNAYALFGAEGTLLVTCSGTDRFLLSRDRAATWSVCTPAERTLCFPEAAYGGGLWVIGGTAGASSMNNKSALPVILTTTDPLADTWSCKQLSDIACGMSHLAYGDGLWVGVGQAYSGSSFGAAYPLAFVSDDPLGEWTITAYTTTTSYTPDKVLYGGGKWVIASGKVLFVSDDPRTGVWTQVTPGVSSGIADVVYHEGQWVILDTIKTGYAYVTDDPATTWTKVTLTLGTAATTTFNALAVADGKWFAANGTALYQANALTGTWVKEGTVASGVLLAYDHNVYSAASVIYSGCHLTPTIAAEGAYTYIKAKE